MLTEAERESVYDLDWDSLKAEYEQRTGHPWPNTPERVIAQFGWPIKGEEPPFAPAWRRAMEENLNDPGMAALRRALARARPERATAVQGPNRNGGRDLVVGDVHGHFPTLERALEALDFDASRDRLFSVGDLIDRGPESERAVEWLESGRITAAVRGNHEQMMADVLAVGNALVLRKSGPGGLWLGNGARWWYHHPEVDREREWRGPPRAFALADRWARALKRLPYMMTIESALGRVGIVHGSGFSNWRYSWDEVWEGARDLSAPETERTPWPEEGAERRLVWRDAEQLAEHRDDEGLSEALPGIDLVVTGHSPDAHPRWARANVLCIDTGVHYAEWGHLTVAEVQGSELTLHRFARADEEAPQT